MMSRSKIHELPLERISLFFDLDGTLAPIVDTPAKVGPDMDRNIRLQRMTAALDGRVAIVSGRALQDIDRILEGTVLCVAGSHGLQRRNASVDVVAAAPHAALDAVYEKLARFARKFPELLVERKPLSVAFHYRRIPSFEATAVVMAEYLANSHGLRLQLGAMTAELLTPGMNKGDAVRAFMTEGPFMGTLPVFVGDDLIDEDGFRAAHDLGGYGVLVGDARRTWARFRLRDVASVHNWIDDTLKAGKLRMELAVEPSDCCL